MHIDCLIARTILVPLNFLRSFLSFVLFSFLHSFLFYSFLSPFLFLFLAFFPPEFFCWIFLYISRSMSEQPQRRYNLHKTLRPCEVSTKFGIYSHWVYRHRAKESAIVNVIARQPRFGSTISQRKVNLSSGSTRSSLKY